MGEVYWIPEEFLGFVCVYIVLYPRSVRENLAKSHGVWECLGQGAYILV